MKKEMCICLLGALMVSCANDEDLVSITNPQVETKSVVMEDEDVISWPTDINKLQQYRKELAARYPDFYSFGETKSNLEENNVLRVAPIKVTGCDGYEEIETKQVRLSGSVPPTDTRLQLYTYYLASVRLYYKEIKIPTGAELIVPNIDQMHEMYYTRENVLSPMGFNPSDDIPENVLYRGFTKSEIIRTENNYDVYRLYTEVWAITHDILGRQIAPLDNPAYLAESMYTPDKYVFQYSYSEIDWGR